MEVRLGKRNIHILALYVLLIVRVRTAFCFFLEEHGIMLLSANPCEYLLQYYVKTFASGCEKMHVKTFVTRA